MNFFDDDIAADAGEAAVVLSGGLRLPLSRRDLASSAGRRVFFGIRPEHISLSETGHAVSDVAWATVGKPAKVPAVIEVIEPLGHRVILTAKSPAGTFQMETEIHAGIRQGEETNLWFDMNRAYLFDRETEAVL